MYTHQQNLLVLMVVCVVCMRRAHAGPSVIDQRPTITHLSDAKLMHKTSMTRQKRAALFPTIYNYRQRLFEKNQIHEIDRRRSQNHQDATDYYQHQHQIQTSKPTYHQQQYQNPSYNDQSSYYQSSQSYDSEYPYYQQNEQYYGDNSYYNSPSYYSQPTTDGYQQQSYYYDHPSSSYTHQGYRSNQNQHNYQHPNYSYQQSAPYLRTASCVHHTSAPQYNSNQYDFYSGYNRNKYWNRK